MITTPKVIARDALRGRWYFVSAHGIVTACFDEADARTSATEADKDYPRFAPHVVTQLAALASSPAPLGEADTRDAARYRWLADNCQHAPDEYGTAGQLYFGTYAAGTLGTSIDVAMSPPERPEAQGEGGE